MLANPYSSRYNVLTHVRLASVLSIFICVDT